ncbi:hypothetical protein ABMA08_09745 [Pseudomonas yamanorum]|jgi:hypothetical protein
MISGNTCKPKLFGPLDKNTATAYNKEYFMPCILDSAGKIKKMNARSSHNI